MSFGNKAKLAMSFLAVMITTAVLIIYTYNKPNGYEVYMNGKHLAYIENKEQFYNAKKDIEKELEKRFGKITLNDNVKFQYVSISKRNFSNYNNLKIDIVKNSSTTVPGVLMKSDGKKVGLLANENEIRKVLDTIKETYNQKDSNGELKLKNHITYIKQDVNIGELRSIQEIDKCNK